jgi:hypothetical protein
VNTSPADLLLASPLGRQLLASYVGWRPGGSLADALFERLGLAPIPGRSALTRAGARTRRWQDVPAGLAGNVIGAAVAWRSWRERLANIGESDLLADLADVSSLFGFSGGDEELWGLTALAARELRPVAEALVDSPGASRWWKLADLASQRFVEWDGQPRLTGPAMVQAVREFMSAERAENAEGLRKRRPRERAGVRIGDRVRLRPGTVAAAVASGRSVGRTQTRHRRHSPLDLRPQRLQHPRLLRSRQYLDEQQRPNDQRRQSAMGYRHDAGPGRQG